MKLYYAPGACSLAPHIVLEEGGFTYESEAIDLRGNRTTSSGKDFSEINPKGYVPTLVLDDGQVLTEGPAINQYLADRVPEKKLVPPNGSMERYRLQEWLAFISTELHKSFSPLFNPAASDDWKKASMETLDRRLTYIAQQLGSKQFLVGDNFTIADAYLFTVLGWGQYVGLDIGKWPALKEYHGRIFMRPAVQATLKAEGLIPSA
ncbi:MAG: glutathione transferase GstA [Rhodocyclales bacterium]|jgi:glutathione S-transferase|nr:glutathione transferase GstA [Rhodocyclales bacterium]MBH1975950.1 glutathione transferase GstA [Rhodocyclales bacterium]